MRTLRTLVMLAFTMTVVANATPASADKPATPPPTDKPAAKATDKPADKTTDKAKPPIKPADDVKNTVSDADAQRFLEFFDKLASIVVANRTDCRKMARRINAHVDTNEALLKDIEAAKQQNKQIPPAVKDKITKKFSTEVEPAMKERCAGDKPVMEALVRIHPAPARPGAGPPAK